MGKKRVVKKTGGEKASGTKTASKVSKKRFASGTLHIQSTYNNTRVSLTDKDGNLLASSSCGALGFKGAKKGTPFAAAKAGELIGDKALNVGIKEVNVIVKGVGAGRESAIRGFLSTSGNAELSAIKDVTPVPHNGPKPKKPRRV
ncbi:TPA: 30S ribosomal protein S11 [Candidatus Campbellbacteria bacterium]|uniref:Small ribosomal subunit protein uS11 n=2 Tax=Candidatus Campbelliibacteriota TaxID=1752727 RepID=A0A1F5EMV4_9BACT|nr:MAG: 30S ribosomal protein S11, small subunit ribosomal protein S11 [Candidatus Campbellbacteria bacterium GW2011_OD1_34_28]KKP75049.1 MAG: Ribosomal protein S11 [Candidatus Campbellbacteria bacterium GW2011_GWD2_35_24]KKP75935.1 MAG: 30S ribosomal protein S11, small subunit ribosomal protein S11 [Candidatus Campbellbacteria bacterium GW2011_GWC2_35_28]KKP76817.1 MAG: Ribosomal protein S11 [Candidatus Campbellbacteria bacterium GW2011_GWC1_35_31]KKP78743.1 MAG: Ribosomal protein S11 [Candida